MPMSRRGVLLLTALILIAGGGWIAATRVAEPARAGLSPAPQVSHPAPDFTLTTVNGETLTLSELKGKSVLLNFWATWCPPCRAEMPYIQAAHEAYEGAGLVVVAVDVQEGREKVSQFARELGLTFPLALDTTGQASTTYQVRAFPTSFFIDREGIIRSTFTGPMTSPVLEERLRSIMQ